MTELKIKTLSLLIQREIDLMSSLNLVAVIGTVSYVVTLSTIVIFN